MKKFAFLNRVSSLKTLVCSIAPLVVFSWVSMDLQADVLYDLTATGAELVDTPGVDMAAKRTRETLYAPGGPYEGYQVQEDSVFFFESNTRCDVFPEEYCELPEKLVELPLVDAGIFTSEDKVTVTLVANLSWVGMGDDASDPHIMLSDGTHLAGIAINDAGYVAGLQPWGGTDLAYCTEYTEYNDDMCKDMGYPDPDNPDDYNNVPPVPPMIETPGTYEQTYDVEVVWTLNSTSTNVFASLLGESGSETIPIEGINIDALDLTGPLSFVFLSDNQNHEVYKLNSLSVRVERLIATCNCTTPGLFDPPMDKNVTVKKGNRVLPLKLTLCDEYGNPLTDMDISAPVIEIDFSGTPEINPDYPPLDDWLTAGHGDDTNQFVYAGDHWQLNLQTKMFATPGTYYIYVKSTDPGYIIDPTCSAEFSIK